MNYPLLYLGGALEIPEQQKKICRSTIKVQCRICMFQVFYCGSFISHPDSICLWDGSITFLDSCLLLKKSAWLIFWLRYNGEYLSKKHLVPHKGTKGCLDGNFYVYLFWKHFLPWSETVVFKVAYYRPNQFFRFGAMLPSLGWFDEEYQGTGETENWKKDH